MMRFGKSFALMRFKCVFSILLILAFLRYYINRRVNIKSRYHCSYAVVTGATGGIAKVLIPQLLNEVNVIAIGRNATELEKMVKLSNENYKVMPFVFDFADDLLTFESRFNQFLAEHKIDPIEIGMCFSNAGHGEAKQFHETSAEWKEKFLHVNIDSHIAVSDYFMKLFVRRKYKSALVITSSIASYACAYELALYHTAKAALAALGSALYAEFKKRNIDVLTVHPSAVTKTRFSENSGFVKINAAERMGLASVTPEQVCHQMMSRLGKVAHTDVGWITDASNLVGRILGENVMVWLMNAMPIKAFHFRDE